MRKIMTTDKDEPTVNRREHPLASTPDSETLPASGQLKNRPDFTGVLPERFGDAATEERRIHPEELTAALRTIEQRKRTVFTGTLPLNETLHQMKIPVSAEEIWQEIEEARKARTRSPKRGNSGPKRTTQIAVGAFALLATALAVRLTLVQADLLRQKNPVISSPQTSVNNPVVASPVHYQTMSSSIFIKTPTMKPLRQFKNGDVVTMDLMRFQEVSRITNGDSSFAAAPTQLLGEVYLDTQPHPGDFHVVRLDNKWYIRGWTNAPDPTPDTANGAGMNRLSKVTIYNLPQENIEISHMVVPSPPPGASPRELAQKYAPHEVTERGQSAKIQVTIPADAISSYSGTGSPDSMKFDLTIYPSRLDKHYRDPWKPVLSPSGNRSGSMSSAGSFNNNG